MEFLKRIARLRGVMEAKNLNPHIINNVQLYQFCHFKFEMLRFVKNIC